MNSDTQGTINKISFLKKRLITTPYGTKNLSCKKLNKKIQQQK